MSHESNAIISWMAAFSSAIMAAIYEMQNSQWSWMFAGFMIAFVVSAKRSERKARRVP